MFTCYVHLVTDKRGPDLWMFIKVNLRTSLVQNKQANKWAIEGSKIQYRAWNRLRKHEKFPCYQGSESSMLEQDGQSCDSILFILERWIQQKRYGFSSQCFLEGLGSQVKDTCATSCSRGRTSILDKRPRHEGPSNTHTHTHKHSYSLPYWMVREKERTLEDGGRQEGCFSVGLCFSLVV